jgi:cellulose synthase/poly-beta-1,6-N-acetylglucosamine synthase-like glycosyltransferase
MHGWLFPTVRWVSSAIIALGIAQSLLYLLQILLAALSMARRPPEPHSQLLWQRYSKLCPPISLVVPAYNEAATIVQTVTALLALQYPNYEVIVVNDGSRDETLRLLVEGFSLGPVERHFERQLTHEEIRGIYGRAGLRLIVVDKSNGGKADAQNAGVNVSRSPVFCVIDGDSILEPDALLRAAQPFVENPTETIAVGGTIRVANAVLFRRGRVSEVRLSRQVLPIFQTVEYLRAFLVARLAWSSINSLMLISGAFSMFRRAEVIEAGGFTRGSLGEDLDMVVKLHRLMQAARRPYRIGFIAEPVCWTEAPSSLKVLARQRMRWHKGALEVFWRYRRMLFNPRYGRIGFIGYGQFLIFDILGPVAEALGYLLLPLFWALGLLSGQYLLAFLGLSVAFGVFVSVTSVMLAELESHRFSEIRDLLKLAGFAVIENFGYRQLNTFWRLRATLQYLRADRAWGAMPRAGFSTKS